MPGTEARAPDGSRPAAGARGRRSASPSAARRWQLQDVRLHVGRELSSAAIELRADLCGDREAGGHGDPERGHLGEVRALPAQHSFIAAWPSALPPPKGRPCADSRPSRPLPSRSSARQPPSCLPPSSTSTSCRRPSSSPSCARTSSRSSSGPPSSWQPSLWPCSAHSPPPDDRAGYGRACRSAPGSSCRARTVTQPSSSESKS